jgi:lysophospholipase L1-like esterase
LVVAASAVSSVPINPPTVPLEDPDGRIMAPVYDKLAALVRGRRESLVRIGFYGDSNLTLDVVSGTLRRILQRRFGDAGHGYVGVGSPFRGYRHLDVHRSMVGYWKTYLYSHHNREGEGFGSGGMAASTGEPHARAVFRTAADDAPVGRNAGRFSVYFMAQPGAGRFAIDVDDRREREVNTAADQRAFGMETVQVGDAPHRFVVTNLERRRIQLLGVSLERSVPGVVVDAFGITGVTYFHLARMDEPITRAMLKARPYDLLLFLIGTNFWRFEQNPQAAGQVIQLHRSVQPGIPIVIMSPPDHVKTEHAAHSDPRVVKVTQQLRGIARAQECAFWDFRQAMGGDASMRTFYWKGLGGADFYHLTRKGAEFMGERLAQALLRGMREYLEENPGAGCDRAE